MEKQRIWKIFRRVIFWVAVPLLALHLVIFALIQIPAVQTLITEKLVNILSGNINGEIEIGRLHYKLFNTISIDNISILSTEESPLLDSLKQNFHQSDTLLYVKRADATLNIWELFDNRLVFDNVTINGGTFNLQNEEIKTTNLERILNLTKGPKAEKSPGKMTISAQKVALHNFRFTLNNPFKMSKVEGEECIDFADLMLSGIEMDAENIIFKEGRLSLDLKSLSAVDKSGYSLQELKGKFSLGDGKAMLEEMVLRDNFSTINADCFYMGYKTPRSFAYFCDSIQLHLSANNSYFSFRTLGYLREEFKSNNIGLFFSGCVDGPIAALQSERLNVSLENGITNLNVKFRIDSLPNPRQALLQGQILNGFTCGKDVAMIVSQFSGNEEIPAIRNFAPFKIFNLDGKISGRFHKLNFLTALHSKELFIRSGITYENLQDRILLGGWANVEHFNAEALLQNVPIASLKATLPSLTITTLKGGRGTTVNADSLKIRELQAGGYTYHNIVADGQYSKGLSKVRITSNDPALKFAMEATYSGLAEEKCLKVPYLNLATADLCALKLLDREEGAKLSLSALCNLSLSNKGYINGNAALNEITFSNAEGKHPIGNILISSNQGPELCTTKVDSDFAELLFSGNSTIEQFVEDIINASPDKDIERFHSHSKSNGNGTAAGSRDRFDGRNYRISLQTHNTVNLMEMIAPQLFIQPDTRLELEYAESDFKVGVESGRVALSNNYIKNLKLLLASSDTTNTLNITSGEIGLQSMRVAKGQLDIYALDNMADISLALKGDSADVAQLTLSSKIDEEWSITTAIKESFFLFAKKRWSISPALVEITDSTKSFKDIFISNNGQNIRIDGTLSSNVKDSLSISMENFDLALLNLFTKKGMGIKGSLSGMAKIKSAEESPIAELDLNGSGIAFKDAPLGSLHLMSRWNNLQKRIEVRAQAMERDIESMLLEGYYSPAPDSIYARASLSHFPIDFAESFLEGIISGFSGTISGDYLLTGTLKQPKLSATGSRFNNFGFNIDFTGVNYKLDGPFKIEEKRVAFNNLDIADRYGKHGLVNGSISHNYFRNILLDLHIKLKEMESLNTYGEGNPVFYGKAFTTGEVSITGPLNKITLAPHITTNGGTDIHIPLIMGQSSAKTTDLLTFKADSLEAEEEDSENLYFMAQQKREAQKRNELSVLFNGDIRPEATLFLEIDKAAGDILKVNGSGKILINVIPSTGFFSIKGDYTVEKGSYRFVLANMLTRDFTIQEGGRIIFNGDISRSRLDLTAIYKVKTSINTLINDTVSVGTRRNVYCKLGITGTLTSPHLKFGIEIPDLDPTTNLMVESALKNEESIQRQFAALLVYGGFAETNNAAGNNINLYSNVSGILSGQLNYLMQHLGIPVGLGVDYNQDRKGNGIYDLSLSTQLFNNRVMVNGNIGNSPYSSQNGSNVVGNIDVEIKLDEKGRVRLNLFSRAPDKYSNYLDDSQRSGAGIVYQKEFNSFKELFRKKSKEEKAYLKELKASRKRLRKEMRKSK